MLKEFWKHGFVWLCWFWFSRAFLFLASRLFVAFCVFLELFGFLKAFFGLINKTMAYGGPATFEPQNSHGLMGYIRPGSATSN